MNTEELQYFAARVAALEFLLGALLAERSTSHNATLVAAAQKLLVSTNYGDDLVGDGVVFKAAIKEFITRLGTTFKSVEADEV